MGVSRLHPMSETAESAGDGDTHVALRAVPASRHTAVSVVRAELREWILSGRLAPGTWLRQADLAQALSVSRMPVREALTLLGEEGLVEVLPHRGARIPPLTLEELEEIYAARMGLEGLAARLAATGISPEALERLRLALPRLAALCTAGDLQNYLAEDRVFMLSVYATSGRPRLVRQLASLRERAERYLRLVFVGADHLRWLDHSYQLFQACAAHDPDAAERVAQEAMRWTLDQARTMLEESLGSAHASTGA